MSRFSIPARLIFLCAVLLSVLVASNWFFSGRLSHNADALDQQTRIVSVLKTANAANKAFGDLKYWLTDLAVSLLVRSEQNAYQARDALYVELERLEAYDPETVEVLRQEVEALIAEAVMAVDAYTDDQRVLGNSLMAKARGHIRVVDARLAGLVDRLEQDAVEQSEAALESARDAADLSTVVVLLAGVLGIALTLVVLRSITQPLRRLVGAMSAITDGNLEVAIPPAGRDEIGAMSRTLSLFRDSLVERDRLAGERERAEQALRRAQTQLTEAIEAISEGFALYDAEDRLVICNQMYRDMYAGLDVAVVPGTTYETIIRKAVEMDLIVEAQGRSETWLAKRFEKHRDPSGP